MSVNKFMHPRNIYKISPNFKQMAIDYPEFRKYVKQDITGKITIDFKDKETLRILSQTLLKKDFDLDVIIPLDRLIPTIPLRLNYILWIEDLLSISVDQTSQENIYGIDIGTGASCIYPLIAAKKCKWHMMATEINTESLNIAQENIKRNNMHDLISVKQSTDETLLKNLLDPNQTYDFCMCNPPFFSKTNELDPKSKSRNFSRPLPRNARSGILCEVISQGGEIEFISKLIKESQELKTQIKIYTSMVGQKSSLPPLKVLLRTIEVVSFKQTEFHQGHTTRWCLAWTFCNIDLRKVPQATVAAARKKPKPPQKFILPNVSADTTLDEVVNKIRTMFQELHMDYEEIKRNQFMYAFHITAKENTWSHQRRKRRQQLRKEEQTKVDQSNLFENDVNSSKEETEMEIDTSTESIHQKRSREDSDEEEDYYNAKKVKADENQTIFLKIMAIVRKIGNEFCLEFNFVEGETGKESVHQIMQYFKNNYK